MLLVRTISVTWQLLRHHFFNSVRFGVLAICLFLGSVPVGNAGDEAPRWGYLEDASAALTIADVANRIFAPTEAYFAKGFGRSAHWVRLESPSSTDLMLLSVGLPNLDDVRLFTQAKDGRWSETRNGDTVPYASRLWKSPFLGFVLSPQDLERPVFLRIASSGTNAVILKLQTLRDGVNDEQRMMITHAALFGLKLMLIALCMAMYVATRDVILVWFSLTQVIWIFSSFLFDGYASVMFPFRTTDIAYSMMGIVSFLAEMVFHLLVIRRFAPARWLIAAAVALVATTGVLVSILWTQDISLALQVRSSAAVVFIIMMVALASTTQDAKLMPLRLLRSIYWAYLAMLAIWTLPALGLTEANGIARHAVVIHGTVNLVLVFIIVFRIGVMQLKESQRIRDDLLKAEIDQQANARLIETQGNLIRMLAHEIGTGLSVISYSIAMEPPHERNRNRIKSAISHLDHLVRSLVDADRIVSGNLALQISRVDPVRMMKKVISERGDHRVGLVIGAGIEGLTIETDAALLSVVVHHLLDNACKYAAADSLIGVEISSDGHPTITFVFRNKLRDGPSPALAELKKRYYRDPHVKSQPGTGVGLSIVEDVAGLLGAQFQISLDGTIFVAKFEVKRC